MSVFYALIFMNWMMHAIIFLGWMLILVAYLTDFTKIAWSLPWQGLKAATKKQKYDKICEKKLSTPIEVYIQRYLQLKLRLCCDNFNRLSIGRFCANHIPWNLHLTSTIVTLWHLINGRIMDFWSAFFGICLAEMVFFVNYTFWIFKNCLFY